MTLLTCESRDPVKDGEVAWIVWSVDFQICVDKQVDGRQDGGVIDRQLPGKERVVDSFIIASRNAGRRCGIECQDRRQA